MPKISIPWKCRLFILKSGAKHYYGKLWWLAYALIGTLIVVKALVRRER